MECIDSCHCLYTTDTDFSPQEVDNLTECNSDDDSHDTRATNSDDDSHDTRATNSDDDSHDTRAMMMTAMTPELLTLTVTIRIHQTIVVFMR